MTEVSIRELRNHGGDVIACAPTSTRSSTPACEPARMFGRVAAGLRSVGRKATGRTYDALIASVALSRDLPLYTCNPDDFQGIDGLTLVAVPHPDHPLG